MARHLGKIIKILKNEKQPDLFDSQYDKEYEKTLDASDKDWEKVKDIQGLRVFINNHNNLKEDQFIDLMSLGKPEIKSFTYLKDAVNNWAKEHNKPEVIQKIINKLKETSDEEESRQQANLDYIAKYTNAPDKFINEYIDKGDEEILQNPNLTKNHIYKMAEKHPEHLNRILGSEHFDDQLAEKFFTDPEKLKNMDSSSITSLIGRKAKGYNWNDGSPSENETEQTLDLNPRVIHSILKNAPNKINKQNMNILLDHADPSFKKQWTDEVLGISNGEHQHTSPEDYEDGVKDVEFQADNWNNWERGDFRPEYNSVARYLAGSRHLDDSQAEHIKRHGDFEDKYALYHNKHIDPRHGSEMFQKWHDDDSHHDYNAEDLIDKYREDKEDIYTKDDLSDDTIEEIRQQAWDNGVDTEGAEQSYPFDEWVDDNEDHIIQNWDSAHDDVDEISQNLVDGDYDWTEENPDSIQNVGDPIFDKLNEIHENYGDSSNYISLEEAGVKDWSDLGIEDVDADGDVHVDTIKDHLDKYGGPSHIDYSNHNEKSIHEHPAYDERYNDEVNRWRRSQIRKSPHDLYEHLYEDYHNSDSYTNAGQEAVNEWVDDNLKDHLHDLYDSSHQDTRFIPEHLHAAIPNFAELHKENKRKMTDGGHGRFFDSHIKDREYEHHYGEDQHYHEMVRDHAKANGGSIDIGTLNKLYPTQKEKWKKIFGGRGKLTHEEASQKVDELPKTKYDISFGKWDGAKMQNINDRDQIVFRLDHSIDSLKPLMDDPSLYETFKKVQKVSKQSGHPTKDNTIAWARVDTTDPKHWMIDEVQSDFGKTVTRYLKEQGADDKADHIDKISAHHKNWRESLTNAVLKEAKKHGADKVSTHSPESKANHTSSQTIHSVYKDSYQKVPRQMGFQPSSTDSLPLTDSASEHFAHTEPLGETKDLGGHTYNLTPQLLKKHIDDCLDFLEALEKGEIKNTAKGALLALGMLHGAHYIGQDIKQKAVENFSNNDIPKHARAAASINQEDNIDPVRQGREEAQNEVRDIVYKNDKKWFLNKYSKGLSPHVYKQTIKNNTKLAQKYGYIKDLSNNTFQEVIEKNPNLRDDVHGIHYDKLHSEFGGDHEKMLHAWKNGVKSTQEKFREPASSISQLGQKPTEDIVDDSVKEVPETPNFTHRRMFRTHR